MQPVQADTDRLIRPHQPRPATATVISISVSISTKTSRRSRLQSRRMHAEPAAASRSRTASVSSTSSSSALPTFEALAPPRAPTTVDNEETRLTIPGLEADVKLKVDAGPGCGGIAWPAGEVLSKYIAYRNEQSGFLKGRKVVELGSGTGLVGIVAGMLESTAEVWVSDQAVLLDLMQANVDLNLHPMGQNNVHVAEYNWGEAAPPSIPIEDIDLVLAADCVYFEPAFPLLVTTLCDLSSSKEVEILFCWKKRRKADKRFFQMLKKHFAMEDIVDDRPGEREKYIRESVSLIRLRRR